MYTQTKFCNHIPQIIIEIGGVKYYAAEFSEIEYFDGDAVINFTDTSSIPITTRIPELVKHIMLPSYKEIMIPWPDFGTPEVYMSFWKELHTYVIEQGWQNVCFHCKAGHGRTGTALAVMLIVNMKTPAPDALRQIRTEYCQHAVETSEQCEYLKEADEWYNNRICDEELLGSSKLFAKSILGNTNYNDTEDEFRYSFVDDEK